MCSYWCNTGSISRTEHERGAYSIAAGYKEICLIFIYSTQVQYTSSIWWQRKCLFYSCWQTCSCSQGGTWTSGDLMRKQCQKKCFHMLFLESGEGPVTVTSWPWLMPVCSGMYHLATRQEENNLSSGLASLPQHTRTQSHTLPIIPRVLHRCVTVSIKQVGREDKGACFAHNMNAHTEQNPVYSFY